MPTIKAWTEWPIADCAVCVGVFDGVHRGHAAILEMTQAAAHRIGGAFCVLTFDKHPAELLAPDRAPRMITSPIQRIECLEAFRSDVLAVLPFDENMANTEPEEFVQKLMKNGAKAVVMGRGAAFGRGARGTGEWLSAYASAVGLEVIIAQPVMLSQTTVSSTAVRTAIASGDLQLAKDLLGHAIPACEGFARGVSIFLDERRVLPPFGEYDVEICAGNRCVKASGILKEGPIFDVRGGCEAVEFASEVPVSVSFVQSKLVSMSKFP